MGNAIIQTHLVMTLPFHHHLLTKQSGIQYTLLSHRQHLYHPLHHPPRPVIPPPITFRGCYATLPQQLLVMPQMLPTVHLFFRPTSFTIIHLIPTSTTTALVTIILPPVMVYLLLSTNVLTSLDPTILQPELVLSSSTEWFLKWWTLFKLVQTLLVPFTFLLDKRLLELLVFQFVPHPLAMVRLHLQLPGINMRS